MLEIAALRPNQAYNRGLYLRSCAFLQIDAKEGLASCKQLSLVHTALNVGTCFTHKAVH